MYFYKQIKQFPEDRPSRSFFAINVDARCEIIEQDEDVIYGEIDVTLSIDMKQTLFCITN